MKSKMNNWDKSEEYTPGEKFELMITNRVEQEAKISNAGSCKRPSVSRPGGTSKNITTGRKSIQIQNTISKNAILHMQEQREVKAKKQSALYQNKFVGVSHVTPHQNHDRNFFPQSNIQSNYPARKFQTIPQLEMKTCVWSVVDRLLYKIEIFLPTVGVKFLALDMFVKFPQWEKLKSGKKILLWRI